MSNGIRSLPRYQQGGVTLPDPEEERRQRLWDLMLERQNAPESTAGLPSLRSTLWKTPEMGEERGGIASLIQSARRKNPLSMLRRLASTVVGRRSDTGYVPGVSEAIYNTVTPDYRYANKAQFKDALDRIVRGDPGATPSRDWADEYIMPRLDDKGRSLRPVGEEDAWRMYLGLPQEHGTFEEAEYRPTISSGEDIRYRDFADPERVIRSLASRSRYSGAGERESWRGMPEEERRRRTLENLEKMITSGKPGISDIDPLGYREVEGGPFITTDYEDLGISIPKDEDVTIDQWGQRMKQSGDVMGRYTLSAGEDEGGPYISYYDKWDLAPKIAKYSRAGEPFDIYGRMYYDPETYEYRGSNE
jgi:hypothetical protein